MVNPFRCAATDTAVFPPHSHRQHEIVFYTEGTGTLVVENVVHRFSAGTIAMIPPGITHSSRGDGAVKRIYLQGDFTTDLPVAIPCIIRDEANGEGRTLVEMIHRNRLGQPAYLNALCHAYLQFIAARICHDDAVHRAVQQIAQEISEQCCDSQCDVTAILQRSGYATDYIRSLVKQQFGKTPHTLLTESRIQRACFLMETYHHTVPLTKIAEECGYVDYVHFSKTFKAIIGCSPRDFLKNNP